MEEIVRDFNNRPKDKEKSLKQLDKIQIALINKSEIQEHAAAIDKLKSEIKELDATMEEAKDD